jgi:hypothetical protein
MSKRETSPSKTVMYRSASGGTSITKDEMFAAAWNAMAGKMLPLPVTNTVMIADQAIREYA